MSQMNENRHFMQCPSFKERMAESDQSKGITPPPFGKPAVGELIQLPAFDNVVTIPSYVDLLDIRRSRRAYSDTPMTGAQLAFILWSTQGIQNFRGDVSTFRTVPSGGARHPFETYITVKHVSGVAPGLYHYRPTEHIGEKYCTIERVGDLPSDEKISEMLAGQTWASKAPVVLFHTCIPYKAEWRYVSLAHRVMLIDLGHLGQNAMLSAAALGLGSCCMAAYDQKTCDAILGLNGIDEYTVYAISVGASKE
ncbi:MAG: SagB/ThcOx family dehydrogenase [Defluviitaleaceae bacterium]|nr:SagB/ThcOx family dehydrogenase [Defluviitaleaceae bacterium]